ncbi:MAG: 5'-methylthioadenosine/adenosylhomocysteine nucleosidase [Muribaculaceae bacterium]|nr:5'-methylthioadenosine/adenosylhomocysteine nucleosidase [Muribaculaceae bacterium]
MKIAIIAAMTKELNLLLPLLENASTVTVNDTVFHTGKIGRHDVVVLRSGIGKVNAAVATLTLIENFHPSLVINSGVAGGTGNANILDVVIPSRIAYHDVWCGPDTVWGQAAGAPKYFVCPLPADVIESLGAKNGLLASGDIFVSRAEEVRHILDLYPDAIAVDMESAAIAQVCHIKNVPFVCIRVISDTPGAADNISQYENFWTDAPQETFNTLTALLEKL